jgi:hypothetical protein
MGEADPENRRTVCKNRAQDLGDEKMREINKLRGDGSKIDLECENFLRKCVNNFRFLERSYTLLGSWDSSRRGRKRLGIFLGTGTLRERQSSTRGFRFQG